MAERCFLCPRDCGAMRASGEGCGGLKIAKAMHHFWEEPLISGSKGSGAIFFYGCNLGCSFCQNSKISRGERVEFSHSQNGAESEKLQETILSFNETADNINLVTAAHVLPQVAEVLKKVKPQLKVPIVYNSGGYEKPQAIELLKDLADVYLPDIKFYDGELSKKYCEAADYFDRTIEAVEKMLEFQHNAVIQDGLIKKGVIIRHLVMPGQRADSMKILEEIAARFKGALVSVMSQYTPQPLAKDKELGRRVTTFEYKSVVERARELGLDGFFQSRESASSDFTPDF